MRHWSRSTDAAAADDGERGSAALEFIVVGLLLLVPVVYLVVALGVVQGRSLGAEAGARHVARAVASAADEGEARLRADRVLASVADQYGLDPAETELALHCLPAGAPCPDPGATLFVTVRTWVALPLVPPVFGLDRLAGIPVEAVSAQKVSRFWGSE